MGAKPEYMVVGSGTGSEVSLLEILDHVLNSGVVFHGRAANSSSRKRYSIPFRAKASRRNGADGDSSQPPGLWPRSCIGSWDWHGISQGASGRVARHHLCY